MFGKYEKEVEKEKKGRPDEKGNKGGRNGSDVGPERATYLTNRVQTIMAVGVSCAVAFGAFACTATGLTRPSLADRNSQLATPKHGISSVPVLPYVFVSSSDV